MFAHFAESRELGMYIHIALIAHFGMLCSTYMYILELAHFTRTGMSIHTFIYIHVMSPCVCLRLCLCLRLRLRLRLHLRLRQHL